MSNLSNLTCAPMKRQTQIAADCVVFDEQDRLLLIKRKNYPFEGQYALPRGFVEYGETTEAGDPRGHMISVAYLVTVHPADIQAGDDAASAEFVGDWQSLRLAFDHNEILSDALKIR